MSKISNLCTPQELFEKLGNAKVCVLDASWYMPAQAIDVKTEFLQKHIPGAVFFHIDEVCDKASSLPHMLPSASDFATALGALGVDNDSDVIVYDSSGLFSAARVWWMFKVFGHVNVKVLDGGLPAWIAFGGATSTAATIKAIPRTYRASLDASLVADKNRLKANCQHANSQVLDARSEGRFLGIDPEPRAGLPSGHMPNSQSLPFNRLIQRGHLRPVSELKQIFSSLGIQQEAKVITTCGSGVTAAIITLALSEAGFGMQRLYDGSWSEWASAPDTQIINS